MAAHGWEDRKRERGKGGGGKEKEKDGTVVKNGKRLAGEGRGKEYERGGRTGRREKERETSAW